MRMLVVEDGPLVGPALKERLTSHHDTTNRVAAGADRFAVELTVAYGSDAQQRRGGQQFVAAPYAPRGMPSFAEVSEIG